jgi:hypothetical protein
VPSVEIFGAGGEGDEEELENQPMAYAMRPANNGTKIADEEVSGLFGSCTEDFRMFV